MRASRALLAEHGVEVLGQAGTAEELVRLVAADPPDVAIVDIRMPPTYTNEGLVAAQEIRDAHPVVATMVLSQHIDVEYALKLVTGTSERVGYLLKDRVTDIDEFVDALQRVAAGEPWSSRHSSPSSSQPQLRGTPSAS